MDIDALVKSMSQQTYERLLQAVETGKWLDGSELSEAQKESSLQAVMMYQAKILNLDAGLPLLHNFHKYLVLLVLREWELINFTIL